MAAVIIKRDQMVALGACGKGLELHDKFAAAQGNAPDTVYPDGWTWLHTAWLYQSNSRFAYWLESNNLVPINDIPDPDIKILVDRARAAIKKTK